MRVQVTIPSIRPLIGLSLFLGLLFPAVVSAERSPYVILDGVRFYCDGCLQLDEKFCALPQSGKSVLIPCAEAFDYLLRANLSLSIETPLDTELVEYLRRGVASSERAALILKVFGKRQRYSVLQADVLRVLLREYPEILQSALAEGWGDAALVERLWTLLIGVRDPKLRGIKGILASRLPDFQLSLFVKELGGELEDDLGLLSVASTFASQFQTPQAETLNTLRTAVEKCSQPQLQLSIGCQELVADPLLEASRSYLIDTAVDSVLRVLAGDEYGIEVKIQVLETLPLAQLHASDAMAITSAALRVLHAQSDTLSLKQLERSRLAELLASSGSSELHVVEEVSQLVKKVQSREAATLPQMPSEVVAATRTPEDAKTPMRKGAVLVCTLGLLASALALVAVRRRRPQLERGYEAAQGSQEAHFERRDAMAFFGLSEHSSEEELRRAYRRLARLTHPDVSKRQEDFIELQEHYERAKRLLANS